MSMRDIELEKARKRVKKKKEFYQHLGSYIAVGGFFFLMNVVTSFGDWWFYYPMLGWGIGLVIHFFTVFGIPGVVNYNEDWEERAIQEELERLRRGKPPRQEKPLEEEELELKELQKETVERKGKKWDDSELV
ncbi:MAG: 2TM domain-containing protein [Saprospiraceae bacterium]|nr:2TM domain-containing protein [Saprospiraceae bacterium]